MAIMLVDDSNVVRSVVKKALALYGYNDTLEAEDGMEALELINARVKKVELFVLDVNMPRMDGITLISRIRENDKDTPIIMLTTETDKTKMVQAKNLGATGWIIKPFETEKFIKVVEMFLPRA